MDKPFLMTIDWIKAGTHGKSASGSILQAAQSVVAQHETGCNVFAQQSATCLRGRGGQRSGARQ